MEEIKYEEMSGVSNGVINKEDGVDRNQTDANNGAKVV